MNDMGKQTQDDSDGESSMFTPEESARFILGLQSAGWTAQKILDFILYITTGEEKYKPGV